MPVDKENTGPRDDVLREAEKFGISATEIVSMFAERRRFAYWRFDGKKAYIAGNFRDVQGEGDREILDGKVIFTPNIDEEARLHVRAEMQAGFNEKRNVEQTYHLTPQRSAPALFHAIGKFRRHDDGSEDLFGIIYECFLPRRVISTSEID
jgi:hypothetical protein